MKKPLPREIIPDHVRQREKQDEIFEQKEKQREKFLDNHSMLEIFEAAYPHNWGSIVEEVLLNLSEEDSEAAKSIVVSTIQKAIEEEERHQKELAIDAQIEKLTYGE